MIVVSDASPINILVRIGYLDVLPELFGAVFIPPAVFGELSHHGTPNSVRIWLMSRPAWLEIKGPSKIDPNLSFDDAGEREAISLALELSADFLLVDDKKARRVAIQRGLTVTGAIGVLELSSARGFLELPTAFTRLRTTDFIITEDILVDALRRDVDRKARS